MSNLSPGRGRRAALPAAPPGHPIASYRTYVEAQRAVDYLSDEKFAVQHVSIVGTDLKMVERVTGRLTYGRVAAAGALSGAYFGSFVGLLLALFSGSGAFSIATVLQATVIGVGFGVMFGVLSYAATGGRRDFTSTSQIVAAQYAVWCSDDLADEATRVLGGLDGGRGSTPPAAPGPSGPGSSGVLTKQPPAPSQAPDPQSRVEAPPPVPTGPTYSEMIARKKAEDAERRAREEEQAPPR